MGIRLDDNGEYHVMGPVSLSDFIYRLRSSYLELSSVL